MELQWQRVDSQVPKLHSQMDQIHLGIEIAFNGSQHQLYASSILLQATVVAKEQERDSL